MAVISTLAVNLIARTSVFQKKLRQSQRTLRNFSRSVGNILKPLARIGMVGVAAATGLAYLIKKEMNVIDTTGKLARRIGVTTENLVGLQHAAQISGVSADILNKAMETFVRRLGEVRMGVGQAKYALESMGISADDLVKQSPVEAFRLIADRINQLSTQADKAAAAYYLMGRQGMTMLNMMQLGSQGLIKLQREAERLGLTFTMEQALRVEAANDALTRMKSALTGIVRTMAIDLAPWVVILTNRFTNWATAGEGLGMKISRGIETIAMAMANLGDKIEAFEHRMHKAKTFMAILFNTTETPWVGKISGLQTQTRGMFSGIRKSVEGLKNLFAMTLKSPVLNEETNAMKRLRTEADRLKLSLRSPLQILKDFTLELQKMYDIGALSLEQVGLLMRARARELWDFTKEIKRKIQPEPQYRFVGGQGGRQFDPQNFIPGANLAAGRWIQMQTPEVKELRNQTTILKLSDQKLDAILDAIRKNVWG